MKKLFKDSDVVRLSPSYCLIAAMVPAGKHPPRLIDPFQVQGEDIAAAPPALSGWRSKITLSNLEEWNRLCRAKRNSDTLFASFGWWRLFVRTRMQSDPLPLWICQRRKTQNRETIKTPPLSDPWEGVMLYVTYTNLDRRNHIVWNWDGDRMISGKLVMMINNVTAWGSQLYQALSAQLFGLSGKYAWIEELISDMSPKSVCLKWHKSRRLLKT